MDVEVARAARALLERQGEKVVTVELTLRFCCGLVTKDAVVFVGAPPGGAGFKRLARDGIELFWRQRFDVEGADPAMADRISPKRLRLLATGTQMSAQASY